MEDDLDDIIGILNNNTTCKPPLPEPKHRGLS